MKNNLTQKNRPHSIIRDSGILEPELKKLEDQMREYLAVLGIKQN